MVPKRILSEKFWELKNLPFQSLHWHSETVETIAENDEMTFSQFVPVGKFHYILTSIPAHNSVNTETSLPTFWGTFSTFWLRAEKHVLLHIYQILYLPEILPYFRLQNILTFALMAEKCKTVSYFPWYQNIPWLQKPPNLLFITFFPYIFMSQTSVVSSYKILIIPKLPKTPLPTFHCTFSADVWQTYTVSSLVNPA